MIRISTVPVTLPDVPDAVRQVSPELYDYLEKFRLVLMQNSSGLQSNNNLVVTAVNSGTSGTFNIASGGHIAITSGIVIFVSTT